MEFKIEGPFIKLGQLLKAARMADMGSDAKAIVQGGEVTVNGETETRRGRKLVPGDVVIYGGKTVELK